MEFYLLDLNFKKTNLIEGYESAIWTERYSKAGDFEFVFTVDNFKAQTGLVDQAFIGEQKSLHVGQVAKLVYKDNKVTITGNFLESFLKYRNVCYTGPSAASGSFSDSLYRKGSVEVVMAAGLEVYAGVYLDLDNTLGIPDHQREQFNRLDSGHSPNIYPTTPQLEFSFPNPINMYDYMVQLAEPNGVGWRFYPVYNGVNYDLIFRAYRGLDRSIDQTVRRQIIHSLDLGTLKSIEEIHSTDTYITNLVMFAPKIDPEAYGFDPTDVVGRAQVSGTSTYEDFRRRTLVVKADDITPEDYHWWTSSTNNGILEAQKVLNQRAKDMLANLNLRKFLNGEVVEANLFKYGTDYFMGDVITLKGVYGAYQNARVVEYVQTVDSAGYKAYPTITVLD
jgi:hypothetical protein